ncbi:MarR family transcriptional regulator [Nonomuraea sp. NPDC050786]|uniref:MarR family winged helix-turn-helix transcriptional regulator n=1 Tax=Nonomuraea sp. NPDC050786 TaxID=3154840 RepID=UPI0033FB2B92
MRETRDVALYLPLILSVKELGELLRLDPGTLSPLLKRLQALGYIHRERNSKDERALAVTLTPAGRELRAQAEKIPPAIVARLGMGIDELQELHQVLTRVIAATRAADDPEPQDG